MYRENEFPNLPFLLRSRPQAIATVRGSDTYPNIQGEVRFYQTRMGSVVYASIMGLPENGDRCRQPIFGFHIHTGEKCEGNASDPFAATGMHYNPQDCMHPYHAGDMPPLFGADGKALLIFMTDRFTVGEIIGRTVVIHSSPDDFTTQPSGNSGIKIACGEIIRLPMPRQFRTR